MDFSFNSNMTQTIIDNTASTEKIKDLKQNSNNKTYEEALEAGKNFEAFFITQMFEHMNKGIKTDSMFGGGHAEKVFRSMLFNEYGKMASKSGSIGIADDIARSIMKMQEKQDSDNFSSQRLQAIKQYKQNQSATEIQTGE